MLHYQEWGEGDPLIAIHPLAIESTMFAGVSTQFQSLGLRTIAVDLPGFGLTPAPEDTPLTPAVLAEPVIEFARSLEKPSVVVGMSLGGRVALEVALNAPDTVRGVALIAPYLPWQSYRSAVEMARYLDPKWAYKLPIENVWPQMKQLAEMLESVPSLQNDWFARACVRTIYYASCPATREAFLSAARELAIDPAYGENGLWDRLENLEVPAVFLWAGKDCLIPSTHAAGVREVLPEAHQLEVPCSGHFVNFPHYRCMERAMTLAVSRALDPAGARQSPGGGPTLTPCLRGHDEPTAAESHEPARLRARASA